MSLPKDLLDQLLSGYLDDALTADERNQVERLLQSNAEVADELAQLRDLRRSLQAVSRMDADIKLDAGFADRVLGAAVARAREEGLGDDHPLVRLSEQPSTSSASISPSRSAWRIAAVMVGLAASIVIAVLMLRPESGPDPNAIASSDPASIGRPEIEGAEATTDTIAAPSTGSTDTGTADIAAVTNDDSSTGTRALGPTEVTAPYSISPSDSIASSNTSPSNQSPATPERSAAGTASPATLDMPATPNLVAAGNPGPKTQTKAILVYDVKRTNRGRSDNAIGHAMTVAGIESSSRVDVTDAMADYVSGNLDVDVEDSTVLYLRSSMKQLDVFYGQLWADEEGVEVVRLALADSAPVLNVVDAISVNPVAIQHEGAAYELFSPSGAMDYLVHELSQLQYTDVDRTRTGNAVGSGPDVPSDILLLIR